MVVVVPKVPIKRSPRKRTTTNGTKEVGVTQGIAPKAILAAAIPALGTLIATVVLLIVTGEYDRTELATDIVGVSSSLLSGLAAYLGSPGDVRYRSS
jgi:hypothetical protein